MWTINNWFVDREKELEVFLKFIRRQTTFSILGFKATGGHGKSWLLRRFKQVCEKELIIPIMLDFNISKSYSYNEAILMTKQIYKDFEFKKLNTTMNTLSAININLTNSNNTPTSVELKDTTIENSEIGNIVGRDLWLIQGNAFSISKPTTDEEYYRSIISENFFLDLEEIAQLRKIPIVWIIDTAENIGADTNKWLNEHLFIPICEGRFTHQLVLIAGREISLYERDWLGAVKINELFAFSFDAFQQYVNIRGVNMPSDTLEAVHKGFKGLPQYLAMFVDGILSE